jgi:glucose-6-phosphate isomerase
MTTWKDFADLKAVQKLADLAQQPYNLARSDSLPPERIAACRASACGFDLLYATQRVDDSVLAALQDLADEAGLLAQFQAMQRGAVMNRIIGHASEERQVLHTACRDVFSDTPLAPEATAQAKEQLARLRSFLVDVESGTICNAQGESFSTIVQVGIGGSDLGPRALYLALEKYRLPGRAARFIANVDPDDAAAVLASLDLSRTLINVVSKSGSTLETRTNEELVRTALTKAGLNPAKHLVAVTGAGSPMDDPAKYRASFHMYDYIGGRYSATSMVGGVTLGFALGYEQFIEVLRGAYEMDTAAAQADIRSNLPLLMALLGIWNRNFLGYNTVAVLPYSQALLRFPAHLQQCDMESNGKQVSRCGSPVTWKTGMLAQSLAMAQGREHNNPNKRFSGNRPSSVLIAEQLTPYTMGALLALYENRIALQGFCWNINSFDQEGVQLGKVLADRLLAALSGEKTLSADAPERSLLKAAGMAG